MDSDVIVPKLFIKSKGQPTTKLLLLLTKATKRFIIRLTGGCGKMSAEDATGLYDFFAQSLAGYDGGLIFGGTQMVLRDDPENIVPGITEIPEYVKRRTCPAMITLGVIPRTKDLGLSDLGMIVSDSPDDSYVTIVHPKQDLVLVTQVSPDQGEVWDAEVDECADIMAQLIEWGDFKNLLIAYNGGSVTEKEIRKTAAKQWPVIMIRGSGRTCDRLSEDKEFLLANPSVMVAEKNVASFRECLMKCGAVPWQRQLTLVSSKTAS